MLNPKDENGVAINLPSPVVPSKIGMVGDTSPCCCIYDLSSHSACGKNHDQ